MNTVTDLSQARKIRSKEDFDLAANQTVRVSKLINGLTKTAKSLSTYT